MKANSELKKIIQTSLGKFTYYNLAELVKEGLDIESFPFSIRILLENILRNQNGITFNNAHLDHILHWKPKPALHEIPYLPARVLMQDFTGVPSIVDIASLRSEMARHHKDPALINPEVPVDLIIDHSVQVDYYGTTYAYQRNVEMEYERNGERYALLKWAQSSFKNFKVLPPGMGICHQVNLEYLSQVVTMRDGTIFPDTLVGTDSHTPMVNGIGVIGWGVGGIEAEAVMLGQPVYFMLPEVIGLKLTGNLKEGTTSTDLVLTVAELLRKKGVVGKFMEVFGDGLNNLSVPDRATISNMSPEFGCTVTYFPPDHKTLEYLEMTGRSKKHIETAEAYLKTNLLWRAREDKINFTDIYELNLSEIEPSIAGPKRPQDKITLSKIKDSVLDFLKTSHSKGTNEGILKSNKEFTSVADKTGSSEYYLKDGAVVIAAITSCTNTSNPSVMLGAGLLAKNAVERGLTSKPWVKTSLAPGSKVVTTYLEKAKLTPFLEALGFHLVGYGCTTCIGNSGPLPANISKAILDHELVVTSVLSGNRNFEARIHPQVKMNFLASPLLVVAFALAGRTDIDLLNEPLGFDPNDTPVYLKDIWPGMDEIQSAMKQVLDADDYLMNYKNIFQGDENWQTLKSYTSEVYPWDEKSTYLKEVPFFRNISLKPAEISDILSARVLLKLGDSITTDHISPAGSIAENSPAGEYLRSLGVERKDFNSYGSRRGNHEVMIRGTFANVRLKNELSGKEGGWTLHHSSGKEMTVFDAAAQYNKDHTPLIILAGKEYGSGSSRDWAAKGTSLLGVRAIIAESFERIHRSNLVGVGILPLQFKETESCSSLGLKGDETFSILNLKDLQPNKEIQVIASNSHGNQSVFKVIVRLDSQIELDYYLNGGILQFVFRSILNKNI